MHGTWRSPDQISSSQILKVRARVAITSYIFGIACSVLVLGIVIEMLRRGRLRERHAIWWLAGGAFALVAGVFPDTLVWAAGLIGIVVPLNLVFFISITVLFLVCIQHSAELTALEAKTRTLAEMVALHELRLSQLSQKKDIAEVQE